MVDNLLKKYKNEHEFEVLISSYEDVPAIIRKTKLTKKEIYTILDENLYFINKILKVENNGKIEKCIGIGFDLNIGFNEEIYGLYILLN